MYDEVQRRATGLGMKVNCNKTQMLCISPVGEKDILSGITTPEGQWIALADALKIVGFHFGKRPTAEAQVRAVIRKFYARLWILRHLKKARVPNLDILAIYKSMVQPVAKFAAPAYHSLLSAAQTGMLEQLQARAMKIIFGWNV